MELFKRDFPDNEIIVFDQSLEEIGLVLRCENESLVERKSFIDQELTRITDELKDIEEAKLGLDLFEEGHHFNAPDIVPISLTCRRSP